MTEPEMSFASLAGDFDFQRLTREDTCGECLCVGCPCVPMFCGGCCDLCGNGTLGPITSCDTRGIASKHRAKGGER